MWEQRTQRLTGKTIIYVCFFIVICSMWYRPISLHTVYGLYASDCNFCAAR